jgi:hypothetical protein
MSARSARSEGGIGWNIIGAIGDGFSQMGGYGSPFCGCARSISTQQQDAEARWSIHHAQERNEALEDAERARNAPRYFSGKEDQLSYDPTSGQRLDDL